MVTHAMMGRSTRRRLGCDRLCAVRSGLGIASSLLDAAGSGLSLGGSLLRALAGGFGARSGLVGAIGSIDGLLCWVRLL